MPRKIIADNKIFHIWECKRLGCLNDKETEIPPTFYQDNGTPICDCGDDMTYVRTEVEVRSV